MRRCRGAHPDDEAPEVCRFAPVGGARPQEAARWLAECSRVRPLTRLNRFPTPDRTFGEIIFEDTHFHGAGSGVERLSDADAEAPSRRAVGPLRTSRDRGGWNDRPAPARAGSCLEMTDSSGGAGNEMARATLVRMYAQSHRSALQQGVRPYNQTTRRGRSSAVEHSDLITPEGGRFDSDRPRRDPNPLAHRRVCSDNDIARRGCSSAVEQPACKAGRRSVRLRPAPSGPEPPGTPKGLFRQ